MNKLAAENRTATLRRWRAEYHPCIEGVHVFQPEGGEFGGITVANFPGATLDIFREFSSVDQDASDDWDLVCDFHDEKGDLLNTVGIRRQDLALIEREIGDRK